MNDDDAEFKPSKRYFSTNYYFKIGSLMELDESNLRFQNIKKGIVTPESVVCYFFGWADNTVQQYMNNKDAHLKTIKSWSFGFSKHKQTQELKALNNLGLADKILFATDEYLEHTINASHIEYKKELGAILQSIDKGAEEYSSIVALNNEAKKNIDVIANELSIAYLGYNPDDESVSELEKIRPTNTFARGAIQDMSSRAVQMIATRGELTKEFPYAAEFLNNKVIAPANAQFKDENKESLGKEIFYNLICALRGPNSKF